jgi:hypothetical protein
MRGFRRYVGRAVRPVTVLLLLLPRPAPLQLLQQQTTPLRLAKHPLAVNHSGFLFLFNAGGAGLPQIPLLK